MKRRVLLLLVVSLTFGASASQSAPPPITIDAPSPLTTSDPSGIDVTYSARSHLDPPANVTCTPAGGPAPQFTVTVHFPVGQTTISCTDTAVPQNTASATVTVTFVGAPPPDTTAPTLTVPSNITTQATSASGAVVTFSATATDNTDPAPTVSCNPASGSLFPIGTTTVTCTATDAAANSAQKTFTVTVQATQPPPPSPPPPNDTAGPVFSGVPATITVQANGPTGSVVTYTPPSAADAVDGPAVVSCSPPSGALFPRGSTTVTCTAADSHGNSSSASFLVQVTSAAPPADVTNFRATAGDGQVRLTWQLPSVVDHVVITRTLTTGGDPQSVYSGADTSFTDRGVTNGLQYRYVIVSVDAGGNRSTGVAATALPRRNLLRSPKDGARLKKPPKLTWVRNSEASYYNVQLFRGPVKILSVWPVKPSVTLKRTWKYGGKRYTLSRGVYRWYVWPGFGSRSAVDYGELLGGRNFQITR